MGYVTWWFNVAFPPTIPISSQINQIPHIDIYLFI